MNQKEYPIDEKKHKEIQELLPCFVTGRISEQEEIIVKNHLKECARCRSDGEEIRSLARDLGGIRDAIISDHIPSKILVKYVDDSLVLDLKEIEAIERHLPICSKCRSDLKLLESLDPWAEDISLMEKEKVVPLDARIHRFAAIKGLIPRIVLKPAFAYILVFILIYPAFLGIYKEFFQLPISPTARIEPRIIQPVFLEESVRASSDEILTIEMNSETAQFALSFYIGKPKEKNIRYDLSIIDNIGIEILTRENIAIANEFEFTVQFFELFPKELFKPQMYTVGLKIIDSQDGRAIKTFHFPWRFRLKSLEEGDVEDPETFQTSNMN